MSDDDELEVEPTDFRDDFLEGEAEIRIRGNRAALLGLVNLLSAGTKMAKSKPDPTHKIMALWGYEFISQVNEQGWGPESLAEEIETRSFAVDTDEVLEMLDVDVREDDS